MSDRLLGVTFVDFMLDGNVPTSRDLLNTSYKISAKLSEFSFITFVSTSDSGHALELSRFKLSFLVSDFEKIDVKIAYP